MLYDVAHRNDVTQIVLRSVDARMVAKAADEYDRPGQKFHRLRFDDAYLVMDAESHRPIPLNDVQRAAGRRPAMSVHDPV
jgi:hypothetical protein